MGLITATFFECGVRYERTTEEGTTKKVNELYIVDALIHRSRVTYHRRNAAFRQWRFRCNDTKAHSLF